MGETRFGRACVRAAVEHLFMRLRAQAAGEDAVGALAIDERCTVCEVRLRPIVFVAVRRDDQIVQCDSCRLILFFVPPTPSQASA